MAARSNCRTLVLALLGVVTSGASHAAMVAPTASGSAGLQTGATSISQITVESTTGLQATSTSSTLGLFSGSSLFTGLVVNQIELRIPSAGQLTVRLDDLNFSSPLDSLSFALVSQGQIVGTLNGEGTKAFTIDAPATMYAFIYAAATPGGIAGSYYLNVSHQFEQPVPLPAALWLLLSGLGFLGWSGRHSRVG